MRVPIKERFVAVTERDDHAAWLERGLGADAEVLLAEDADPGRLAELCDQATSNVIFVRFDATDAARRANLVSEILRRRPRLCVVAIGDQSTPDVLLAAMRAGARDWIDLRGSPGELREVVARVAAPPPGALPASESTQVAVLCGRPDVATSTFSVHLALAFLEVVKPGEEVLLVDLGQPSSDSLLYLDLVPSYTFADAARSVRRFDQTLVQTAFARHKSGLAVLPLPEDPAEMDSVSPADMLALFDVLKDYFRYGVVNLGGLRSDDFLVQALARVDQQVLIADQAVVSCAAAHKLVEGLAARGVPVGEIALLVDRYTDRLDPNAERIAELLGVKLVGTLPPNGFELLRAMNLAQSVFESAPRSPYGAGVRTIAARLAGFEAAPVHRALPARFAHRLRAFLGGKRS